MVVSKKMATFATVKEITNTQVPEGQKTMILIISILGGYALGIYVGRNWDKYTTE